MSPLTLNDLITLIRDYIDEPTPQNWSNLQLTRWINRRQQMISVEIMHVYEDYFEIQSALNATSPQPGTVIGQELYPLPADFLNFKRIERSDTGQMLPAIDINEKITIGSSLVPQAISGVVLSYYVVGNYVGFTPTPQAVIPILMTYVQRLTDLENGTDVSNIPAEHHHLMAIGASIDAFINDESDTTALQKEWDDGIDRIKRTLRNRQIQQPRHIRQTDVNYGILL